MELHQEIVKSITEVSKERAVGHSMSVDTERQGLIVDRLDDAPTMLVALAGTSV
jgi:hypothetical protein